jgi:hypothetical protein
MDTNDNGRRVTAADAFRVAAAVVVIGLILAASEGSINVPPTHTLHDTAAAQASAPATEYFPSGYTLNASEPEPHIEAF